MSISTFFDKHANLINIFRFVVLPLGIATCLFYLDQRYVQREDLAAYKQVVQSASVEQQHSMARLTDAITALVGEQRNVAELQRVNTAQIKNISELIKDYQASQSEAWRKNDKRIEKIEDLMTTINTTVVKHETILSAPKR